MRHRCREVDNTAVLRLNARVNIDRPEQVQADVFEAILRTVHGLRAELNVTHWELFTLRDADSSKDGLFYNFGILRDDYSRKPAFARLRALIAELGRPPAP